MATAVKMHLVHDQVETFRSRARTVPVRVRLWRRKGAIPVALLEPAGDREITDHCGRIATWVHNGLLRGRADTFVYVEHEAARWSHVRFGLICREHFCDPKRYECTQDALESIVGENV